MKIKYEFITGEVTDVEAPGVIVEVAAALDRDLVNNNRRERRRHNSLELMQEKGHQLADNRADILFLLEQQELTEALHKAVDKLLPQQKELIQKVFFDGTSVSQIARQEGVGEGAVRNRLRKIYKKLKELLV